MEGTNGQISDKGGNIIFNNPNNYAYTYSIVIKSDENPAAFPPVTLTGTALPGQNTIPYDGKDGQGNPLPQGSSPIIITINFNGGEVHFPFVDVEYNTNGVIIKRMQRDLAHPNDPSYLTMVDDKVYWDDSPFSTSGIIGSVTSPINNTHLPPVNSTGIASSAGTHSWGTGAGNSFGTWGDARTMDTWTFFNPQNVAVTTNLIYAKADLQITSIVSNKTTITQCTNEVEITVKAKNNGQFSVGNAPFTFEVPAGFTFGSVVFSGNSCGAESANANYNATAHKYYDTLSLPNGCEVTYVFTLTTPVSPSGTYNFGATILRPNDVTDIDATDPDITSIPTDPYSECANNGIGGNCNNIKHTSINSSGTGTQITATISGSVSVCKNENGSYVTIVGAGGTVPYTFTYTINGGTAQTVVSVVDTAKVVVPTNQIGDFQYDVTLVSDNSTCQNPLTLSTIVHVLDIPSVNLTADTTAVCSGENVILTASGATTYSWNPGNGSPTSNPTNSVSPTTTTTYIVTGTEGICSNKDTITVTVHALPTLSAFTDQKICLGDSVIIVIPNNEIVSWSPNVLQTGVPFYPTTTETYTATLTDAFNCIATQQVTIEVDPVPTTSVTADKNEICSGKTVVLTASGASNYSWAPGNSNPTTNPTNSISPTTTTTYIVTGMNGGCSKSDTITITVHELPTLGVLDYQTICSGDSIVYVSPTNVSVFWSPNVIQNGIPFYPTATATYTATLVGEFGCTATQQLTIEVNPIPTVSLSADPSTGLPGTTINFENNSSNAQNYNWNFGNGTQYDKNTKTNENQTYTQPGDYQVILIASNGTCSASDTIMVSIIPFPVPEYRIPNVFTPNKDGKNDDFEIQTSLFESYTILILNRWGNQIIELNQDQPKWDGGDCVDGVYFYLFKGKGLDGQEYVEHGFITLLR